MSVVGELPAEMTQAPEPKPKSRKKIAIIAAGVTAAIVVAIVAATAGGGGLPGLALKPDAQATVKSYLLALSEGKGEDALKHLDGQTALDLIGAKVLGEATSHIQDIKVGEDLGVEPQEQDGKAEVRATYMLGGNESTVDFHLVDGEDGWVIQDPETIMFVTPVQEIGPTVNDTRASLDYTATVGESLVLQPGTTTTLLPAEYPLTYTGSNKYFNFKMDSFSTHVTEDFIGFDLELVGAYLQPQMTKYVNDCIATGETKPELGKGLPCGFASVDFPAEVSPGVQTDKTDWTITSPPVLQVAAENLKWSVDFAASAHRVRINASADIHEDEQLTPSFHCDGQWTFTAQGEPQFTSGFCDSFVDMSFSGSTFGNGKMYALTTTSSANPGAGNGTTPPTLSPEDSPTMGATFGAADDQGSAPAASPTVSAPTPTATQRIIGDAPQGPERGDWTLPAEAFAKAWANGEGGKEAWLARIRPHVTDKLYVGFESTIMQNVYTDEFVRLSTIEEKNSYVIFTGEYTKNGVLFQGMAQVQGNGEWRIATVEPPSE